VVATYLVPTQENRVAATRTLLVVGWVGFGERVRSVNPVVPRFKARLG
jgi:hypothetical protein